jgi:hypothetical protein
MNDMGIAFGESVEFKVQTVSSDFGASVETQPASDAIIFSPLAVTVSKVDSQTDGDSIGLSWTNGQFQGASEDGYKIWMKNANDADFAVLVEDIPETQREITQQPNGNSIEAGATYVFKVQAKNTKDYGFESDEISIKAANKPFAVATPQIAFNPVTDKITITFDAPSSLENGADFEKFKVYMADRNGDFAIVTCADPDPLATECEFTQEYIEGDTFNLNLGGVIRAYVIGYNSYGPSPASAE